MAKPKMIVSDDSDSDADGVPLQQATSTAKSTTTTNGNGKRPLPPDTDGSDLSDDDNQPLSKRIKPELQSSTAVTHVNGKTSNGNGKHVSDDSDDDDDEDMPLAVASSKASVTPVPSPPSDSDDDGEPLVVKSRPPSRKAAMKPRASTSKRKVKQESSEEEDDESSDDDDVPLIAPKPKPASSSTPKPKAKPARKRVKKEESPESEDDDFEASDVAPPKKKKAAPRRSSTAKAKKESDDDEEDVKPKAKGKAKKEPKKKAKKEDSEPPKKERKTKKQEKEEKEKEEEEEVHRWWEQQQAEGDDSIKWTTLTHNGVLFPPPYTRLPNNVKMKYDGQDMVLSAEAEEVAGFFAALLESDHAADERFKENFFTDWLTVMKDHPSDKSHLIQQFDKCDFRPMFLHLEAEKAAKKAMNAAEKKAVKAERDALEAPYRECVLDGRKEKVGNFRIEPPGLFRGRGEHPKKGCLKFRVQPQDIILNIGKEATIPVPNVPGKWMKVVNDQTVTWLANWKENVNGNFKYVFLAAGSSIKGQSDMAKFEKARDLKSHVARIRKDYEMDLKSKVTAERQRATAMYFIDKLALRAGNEKGEDEADTVGCCSLRCEHVTLSPPNELTFDFLGKDSIRYFKTVAVDPQVFRNIRIFKGDGKEDSDPIFDRVTTAGLNKHLQSYMKGLTAKVFRTYNASITFQQQLDENTPEKGTDAEKLAAYTEANRMVAILCNHQKSVSKGHGSSMEKMSDKLRGLKYQRMKLRHILFTLDPKLKKKHKDLQEDESDIDDDFIEYWEEELMKKDVEKATKKFEKENEKLEADGSKPKPETELNKMKKEIEKEYKELAKERGKKEVNTRGYKDTDKVLAAIEKQDGRIKNFKVNIDVREKGKDVSLGTSKINYLDPRITAAWCKKHDIPVAKLFSKTLVQKFPWAMEVDKSWTF